MKWKIQVNRNKYFELKAIVNAMFGVRFYRYLNNLKLFDSLFCINH